MSDQSHRIRLRVGDVVGKLTIQGRASNIKEGRAIRTYWRCKCECGNTVYVSSHSLSKGQRGIGGTRSCGCLMGKTVKHGKAESRVYGIWHQMKQRCENPRNAAYRSYGARGISVDEKWKSFAGFYEDMGDPPDGYTLERVNNSLGYSKANCKWASRIEQGNNRRSNTFIEFAGQRETLANWARRTGLPVTCIRSRLNSGWSIEKALVTPKLGKPKLDTH